LKTGFGVQEGRNSDLYLYELEISEVSFTKALFCEVGQDNWCPEYGFFRLVRLGAQRRKSVMWLVTGKLMPVFADKTCTEGKILVR